MKPSSKTSGGQVAQKSLTSHYQVHWSPIKCNIPRGFAGKRGGSGGRRKQRHHKENDQLFQAGHKHVHVGQNHIKNYVAHFV